MIEFFLMLASLVVLGYPFYISLKMYWIYKLDKGPWKWLYAIITFFLACNYFLFSLVLFVFIASSSISQEYISLLNVVVGTFFLSGAGLVSAIMKYHLNTVRDSMIQRKSSESGKLREIHEEIRKLRNELETEKKFRKFSVNRELRMIELKKKIERLEKK